MEELYLYSSSLYKIEAAKLFLPFRLNLVIFNVPVFRTRHPGKIWKYVYLTHLQ
jgi:hypothetical protein